MALTDEGLVEVPGLASRWVRLASGAKAHYVTSGDSGPAIVLLHGGLPGSSGTAGWRSMAPILGANGFQVYCPDLPGFGLADITREHWPAGLHSHVDFIQELTTALCLERFHLAGNSLGCINTVNYALAHPERVISCGFIGSDFGDVVSRDHSAGPNRQRGGYDGTREGMRKLMTAIVFNDQVIDDEVVEMRWLAAERQQDAYAQFVPSLLQYMQVKPWEDNNLAVRLSTRGRLDRLSIPAICVHGRDDRLAPVSRAHEQEDVLPNIQFFYPGECGHQAQTDRPELLNQLFLEFFRDGVVSRQTADAAGVSTRRQESAALVAAA